MRLGLNCGHIIALLESLMDVGLAAVAAALYFSGFPNWAFWVLFGAFVSGFFAAWRFLVDPPWYIQKRLHPGLEFNDKVEVLTVAKIVRTAMLGAAAWWLGSTAGYF
jgi:hypothetical protein